MNVAAKRRWEGVRNRVELFHNLAFRVFFGTRTGVVVFLGTLCFVTLYWQVEVFINDNYTLVNALVSLADGHLAFQEATYGTVEAPGTGIRDGRYYGRNYGQLVFALPFVWALQGIIHVADP